MSCPGPRVSLRPLAVAALALIPIVTIACTQAPAAPSQEAYTSRADQVCEEAEERLADLAEEREADLAEARSEDPGAPVDQRPDRWTRAQVVPEYQDLEAQLRGIGPPDGDGSYLSDLYDDLGRRVEELRLSPGRGRDAIRADEDLRRRFASYGMEVCGTV